MPCPPDPDEKRFMWAESGLRNLRPAVEAQRYEVAEAARLLARWPSEYNDFPNSLRAEAAELAARAAALPPVPDVYEATTWPGEPEVAEQRSRLAALRTMQCHEEVLLCEMRTLLCRYVLNHKPMFWSDDEIWWEHQLAAHRIHREEDRAAILRHLVAARTETTDAAEVERITQQIARIEALDEHQLLTAREFV